MQCYIDGWMMEKQQHRVRQTVRSVRIGSSDADAGR